MTSSVASFATREANNEPTRGAALDLPTAAGPTPNCLTQLEWLDCQWYESPLADCGGVRFR